MKEFRRNIQGHFICEECGILCKTSQGISRHLKTKHNMYKEYYDKWLKESGEGICKTCEKETEFISFKKRGYKVFCSDKCLRKHLVKCKTKESYLKTKNTNILRYGVENVFQFEEVKQKIKQTKTKKYNDEYFTNYNKTKQTKREKYGNENYNNQEKFKQTCLERYNVEHPQQNIFIHTKTQKSGYKLKRYKDTDLWYQGTYEKDFLDKHINKYPDITRGPSIKYVFEGNNNVYHSDFYIKLLNLIVEIKSTWIIKLQGIKHINAKKKAAIAAGYNYIMIVNKDYSHFPIV